MLLMCEIAVAANLGNNRINFSFGRSQGGKFLVVYPLEGQISWVDGMSKELTAPRIYEHIGYKMNKCFSSRA